MFCFKEYRTLQDHIKIHFTGLPIAASYVAHFGERINALEDKVR